MCYTQQSLTIAFIPPRDNERGVLPLTYRHAAIFVAVVTIGATIAGCGNNPVATVGGVKVTETEFNDRLVQAFGSDVLRSMIDRELIRQAAEDKGIELTEEELARKIEEAKQQYESEEQFQQFLAARDLSEEEWKEDVKVVALAEKLALQGVDPTEEDLKQFLEEHKRQFARPATVSLSEIVVSSKEEAQEVLQELESADASFADLASRYSLKNTRERGGERPEMPISRIEPFLRGAATSLPVGDVSDPIEANGSWYIIKVRDRQQAREASFETDRERIEQAYKRANANSVADILKEQMKKTNVNIVDPRFQQLNEVYTVAPDEVPQFGAEGGATPAPTTPEGAAPQTPVPPPTDGAPEAGGDAPEATDAGGSQ